MGKTIAQFTLTGITDMPVDELREKMTLQEFEEVRMMLKTVCGMEICLEIDEIEMIEVDEF